MFQSLICMTGLVIVRNISQLNLLLMYNSIYQFRSIMPPASTIDGSAQQTQKKVFEQYNK